ncbi:toxin Cry1Ac domain D-VI-related protein [Lactococcus lactis]
MLSAISFINLAVPAVSASSINSSQSTNDTKLQQAIDAVDQLFEDASHTTLSPTTTLDSITAARKLVLKSGVTPYLQELSDLCTKAGDLLKEAPTNNTKLQQAIDAVDQLFEDASHTTLSPTTTLDSITAARKLVLKSGVTPYLQELSDLCTKAGDLLKEAPTNNTKLQQAIDAVDQLFEDASHTTLSPTTTLDSITAARKLVLKSGVTPYLQELSDLCTKASDLLKETPTN